MANSYVSWPTFLCSMWPRALFSSRACVHMQREKMVVCNAAFLLSQFPLLPSNKKKSHKPYTYLEWAEKKRQPAATVPKHVWSFLINLQSCKKHIETLFLSQMSAKKFGLCIFSISYITLTRSLYVCIAFL